MAAKKTHHGRADRQRRRREPAIQAKTLRGLGLGKIHRTRTLEDTPPCAA